MTDESLRLNRFGLASCLAILAAGAAIVAGGSLPHGDPRAAGLLVGGLAACAVGFVCATIGLARRDVEHTSAALGLALNASPLAMLALGMVAG